MPRSRSSAPPSAAGWSRARRWRLLQSDGPHPTSPVDRAVAWALGSPALAAVGAVVVVSLIFAGLLRLGPPTQWFS